MNYSMRGFKNKNKNLYSPPTSLSMKAPKAEPPQITSLVREIYMEKRGLILESSCLLIKLSLSQETASPAWVVESFFITLEWILSAASFLWKMFHLHKRKRKDYLPFPLPLPLSLPSQSPLPSVALLYKLKNTTKFISIKK